MKEEQFNKLSNEEKLAYYENEVKYFEDAIDGIKKTYAILSSLLEFNRQKLDEHIPERETIQD